MSNKALEWWMTYGWIFAMFISLTILGVIFFVVFHFLSKWW